MGLLSPPEIVEAQLEKGIAKAMLPIYKMLLLGILAGAFIAFGAQGSCMAKHMVDNAGIANIIGGTIFSVGLMMVIIGGAELFTGNVLIGISCMAKQNKWRYMFKNWFFVYIGNMAGALLVTYILSQTDQLNLSGGALGGYTIRMASVKVAMDFSTAFYSGILCNWIVCMAVWMSTAAKDVPGKVLSIFFPIWLFASFGFEHCVANMYFIPAGIFAAANPHYVDMAMTVYNVSAESIANLTAGSFLMNNLLPVTLGNIVGGFLFVGCFYFLIYKTNFGAKPE